MRKRSLVILGVLVLALSLGIGTMAGADTTIKRLPRKPQESQKVELKSFLEDILDVRHYNDKLSKIVVDEDMLENYTYTIEFIPKNATIVFHKKYCYSDHEHYSVKIFVDLLIVTPKDNVEVEAYFVGSNEFIPVTPWVSVYIWTSDYDNPKDLLRFLSHVVKAMKDQKKISMEVTAPKRVWGDVFDKGRSRPEIHFDFHAVKK